MLTSPEAQRFNETKLGAFVAAFRARYPELAREREDSSIETIAVRSCEDIAHALDEQASPPTSEHWALTTAPT